MITRRPPISPPDPDDEEDDPKPTPIWKRHGVQLLTGAILLFLVVVFIHRGSPPPEPDQAARQSDTIAVTTAFDPGPTKTVIATNPPAPPEPPPSPVTPPPPPPPPDLVLPRSAPSVLAYNVTPHPPKEDHKEAEKMASSHTTIDFKASTIPGSKAGAAIDDTLVLWPGLLICVLDTAIDSNLPGPLLAHTPAPVYSRKGVILLDDQTDIEGSYESLSQNGVERLQSVGTFAWTKYGVPVPLDDMPMADDLGRTGLSASIDHRYVERFAGAILLDLAQAGLSIAQAEVSKGGNSYVSFSNGDSLASQILRSTINLPPIGKKPQGSWIAIWIKHPIDFSDSYRLRAAR